MQYTSKLSYYVETIGITNDNCIEKLQCLSSEILYEIIYDPKLSEIISPENIDTIRRYYWTTRSKHHLSQSIETNEIVENIHNIENIYENIILRPEHPRLGFLVYGVRY